MRWVFRLAGLLAALVLLAIAAIALIPGERIAGIAAERFTASTGRDLRFLGDVRPSLWPELGVATGAVEIDGPDGAPMLSARGLSVGVDPFGLLSGDIRFRGIEIDGPDLRLAVDDTGRGNWETGAGAEGGGGAAGGMPAFTLDRLTLRDARVSFTGADGSVTEVENLQLTAALPDPAGPAEADFSARALGLDLSGALRLDTAGAFLAGDRVPLSLTLAAEGAEARFEGNATLAGVLDGELEAVVSDPSALRQLAGLPDGLGRESLSVETGIALAGDSLALAGFTARLDGNTVTGAADITFAEPRPRVDADLDIGAFDLSSAETPADEKAEADGWSTDPIDVSFLGLADGRIRVSADSLALGTARLGPTVLSTVIEDRRSVTAIERMVAYDGSVGGEVVLNGRDGFSTGLDVAGSALAISRLLSELVGYDRLIAAGDLQLDVIGSGPHMDAVMNSLDGEGAVNVGAGELIGLDIVAMIRNLDPSLIGDTRRTIFDRITVTFRVEDGVVIYDDLEVRAPLFRASGTGRVGVGGQTLDMRLMPELLGGERAGIRVPLLVTGTWDAPRVRLDLESVLREGVEREIEERLQGAGTDLLGGSAGADGTLEDAVRGRIADEIGRGLGGLLGR